MTEDKGRPDGQPGDNPEGQPGQGNGQGDGYGYGQGDQGGWNGAGESGPHGQQGYDPNQYGRDPYGQQGSQGQYGQDPYGQQGYGGYAGQGQQGQYGGNQYGQDSYGQQGYPGDQGSYGQQGFQGYQGYQGQQGYQGYGGYAGQGQGQGQFAQQNFGDPGVGVAQPGGDEPPTSPVFSGPAPFNITQPLSTAFKRVNANIGPWLGFSALAIVSLVVFFLVFMTVIFGGLFSSISAYDPSDPTSVDPSAAGIGAAFTGILLMYPVLFALMFVVMVFMYRGAFEEIDGRRPSFGTFFRVNRWGALIGAWLISGLMAVAAQIPGYILMFVGLGTSTQSEGAGGALVLLSYLLLIAGSIAVAPITALIPLLVMDGRAKVLEAPALAWSLVKGRFWSVLGAMLLAGLVGAIGIMLCYVGALYTMPIQMVAYAEIYRQLIGGRRPVPMA
ncbi:hypothetical protein [Corynebacterium xerosis]|uniref:hypothetical protein n=1 Tax=Corynebacterium xerosis TaxID=1725 RepID=UPI0013CE42B0|nr:hypothetical protein [Corynebacterium xerosis]